MTPPYILVGRSKKRKWISQADLVLLRKLKAEQERKARYAIQISKRLRKQKENEKRDKIAATIQKFRPKKSERGKIIVVNTQGKRLVKGAGKKGYPVYITKSGKKKWLKTGDRPLRARKFSDIQIPIRRNLKRATREFENERLVRVSGGRALVRSEKTVKVKAPGGFDFNGKVVKTLAKDLKRTIEAQDSQRQFLCTALVLIRLPNGQSKVYDVAVPIAKPDHIAIELGGMENFVREKVYTFMARALLADGYVTTGSANHVRRLSHNEGLDRSEWTTKDGEAWRGNEAEEVRIESIEWKIEQAERDRRYKPKRKK